MSYLGHFRNEDHHGVRLADNLHGGKNTGEATISRRDLITCICLNLISALFSSMLAECAEVPQKA